MKGLPFVLLFTVMTFLSWGAYGPVLHHGAEALDHDSLRAFVGVGLAYFMIAVLIPFFILKKSGESGKWTVSGSVYSLIAGAVGAVGALGIILALGYGGSTVYVMPLVFGFAPIVNTLVTAMLSRTFNQIRPIFIAGVVAAALGAGGVLFFKPARRPPPTSPASHDATESNSVTHVSTQAPTASAQTPEQASEATEDEVAEEVAPTDAALADDLPTADADVSDADVAQAEGDLSSGTVPATVAEQSGVQATVLPEAATAKKVNFWGVLFSIVIAAACWGSYGPMLHIGQGKMAGSRLRPFACVGLAYFFIAVAAPLVLIYSRSVDLGTWTASGMTWSFLAGVAGAIGALGVILAFNAGGKPYYVMPLIFGFAPVINTFISLSETGTWSLVRIEFWISLAVVIAGAVTVLTNAPKPQHKKPS